MTNMQLKMNFTDTNPLKERFASAQFTFLIEYQLPASSAKLAKIYEDINAICEYSSKDEKVAAITLTDRLCGSESLDPLDLAAKVSARSGKSPIIHMSGKGHNQSTVKDRLATMYSAGMTNLLALSGDLDDEYNEYIDSVEIIKEAKILSPNSYIGASVNPFKYTVNDSYGQYLKMIRKVKAGAEFIVTQVGWDMKKLQELLLFARMRELNIPLIARLSLISEEDGRKMSDLSLHKGVSISREFASQVQRELSTPSQYMSAQLKRLSLQVAGCSLMGYSGVQLCGLKTANEVSTVMDNVAKMLQEFRTFKEWAEEWQQFHHGVSMVTPPYTFYMFKNLMKFQTNYDLEDGFKQAEAFFEEAPLSQKVKCSLASTVKLEERKGFWGKALRKVLTGSSEEVDYDLSKTHYISINQCPKKLHHGPCGGSLLNGDCEHGESPCVHNLKLSMAAHKNEVDKLEDPNE